MNDNQNEGGNAPPKPKLDPREERLKKQLRANLRRRKAKARASEPEGPDDD